MENFFTRVKERTTPSTWLRHWYHTDWTVPGFSAKGCLAGQMGIKNHLVVKAMTPEDQLLVPEAYQFACQYVLRHYHCPNVEAFNDQYANSLHDVHKLLDELAEAWESRLAGQKARDAAEEWAKELAARREAAKEEAAWAALEADLDKVDEKPMYKRFVSRVETWLKSETEEKTEKEMVSA